MTEIENLEREIAEKQARLAELRAKEPDWEAWRPALAAYYSSWDTRPVPATPLDHNDKRNIRHLIAALPLAPVAPSTNSGATMSEEEIENIRDSLGPKFRHLAPMVAAEMIPALVEGLHAQIFAVHSAGDPDASHASLGDGGQIHETVHALVRALPARETLRRAPKAWPSEKELREMASTISIGLPQGAALEMARRLKAWQAGESA